MKIETTRSGDATTLVLRGEFDTNAADTFLTEAESLLGSGSTRLLVSFRYVKYLNSTALGAIVRARSDCRARGGDLVVLKPSRLSRDIISKMGLDAVLPMFDDDEAAASYLRGEAPAPEGTAAGGGDGPEAVRVMFWFDDDRAALIPGKHHHGIGILDAVDDARLVFRWHPERNGCDATAVATMFATGSRMHNKLQLRLLRKEFFEGESAVEKAVLNDDGEVVVTAGWSRIADGDRSALERHKRDLDYLQTKTGESSAGA